jgi:hypothetical protein
VDVVDHVIDELDRDGVIGCRFRVIVCSPSQAPATREGPSTEVLSWLMMNTTEWTEALTDFDGN